jgi:sec-independent protein translocase protein TatB
VFSNLNWPEIVLLLLLALFIFGERLPQAITSGLRMLRNLRRMAQNATGDLSRELGTDIRLEDLHPKTFIRKHVLSEADQDVLLKPLKGVSEDILKQSRALQDDFQEVGKRGQVVADEVKNAADLNGANPAPPPRPPAAAPSRSYDDAT